MDKLLIRVDSTYESGMGHFMRTLALAQKWQKERGCVYFLINDNDYIKKRIIDENMDYIVNPFKSGTIDDSKFLISLVEDKDVSWCVIDGYVFKDEYYNFLRKNNLKFLIFDDDGKLMNYNSNIVLNQNLHGKKSWYDSKKEDYTTLLIGTNFVLLRNEFLKHQNHEKIIYIPVYKQPYYQNLGFKDKSCLVCEEFYKREISIPMYPTLTDEDIEFVKETLLNVISQFD